MDTTSMDPQLSQAFEQALGHGPPFPADELATLRAPLRVTGARDLAGLLECRVLSALHLHACEIANLDTVAHLSSLHELRVTCSTVGDIEALARCKDLTELELAFTLVQDARPIQALDNLRRVVILGNPLDEQSYHEVLVPLRETRVRKPGGRMVVELPTQYDWSLTRELRAAGIQAGFDVYDGTSYLVKPGITQDNDAEVLQVPSSHIVDTLTLWEIQEESQEWLHSQLFTQAIPRVGFPQQRHYIVGDALEAQDWITHSDLPEDTERSLSRLVSRFPGLQYARYTEARLHAWQNASGVVLPEWFIQILTVLADMVPGLPTSVRLDGFDHWTPSVEWLGRAWYQLGLTTPMFQHRTIVDCNGYLAIGMWLETLRSNLAINVRDLADPRIYEYSLDDVGEAGLAQSPRVVFDSYTTLLNHISSIQIGGALNDPPSHSIIKARENVD